jgi:hypothetical protein
MAEEKTFYRHDGVRGHDVGSIASAAQLAAQEDHDEQYGRAGTFEFLRFEDFQQRNWREGHFGEIRKHRCTVTAIWQHKP